ncbi:EAL domain-containing protein [Lusitaniella coriacea]|uniref:EAL domain-containing protein n=1 Tax=Lusitaniella coriacea TaxID=1983105 RepID=UPI003CF8EF8A
MEVRTLKSFKDFLKKFRLAQMLKRKSVISCFISCFFIIVTLSWTSLLQTAKSQTFEQLSNSDGLSQVNTRAITQGEDGLLYIGTEEGLNVYDGYHFQVFRQNSAKPHTLADSDIYTTFVAKDGTIWVGSRTALNRFDAKLRRFQNYFLEEKQNINISQYVADIVETSDNKLWLGIKGYRGIGLFEPGKRDRIEYIPSPPQNSRVAEILRTGVNSITLDRQEKLWLGTDTGLVIFSPKTQDFVAIDYDSTVPKTEMGINDIYYDRDNTIWLSTNYGLYHLNAAGKVLEHFFHDNSDSDSLSYNLVRAVLRDRQGRLWIATDRGLNIYIEEEKRFRKFYHEPGNEFSPTSNSILNIFQDSTGVLWFSTYDTGLNKLTSSSWLQHLQNDGLKNSLSNGSTWAIHKSSKQPNDLWIGTREGLDKLNLKSGTIEHFRHNPNDPNSIPANWIVTIFEDSQERLWMGSRHDGLILYDRQIERFRHYPSLPNNPKTISNKLVYDIIEDNRGRLWFGGMFGLNRYDPATDSFIRYNRNLGTPKLEGLKIFCLHQTDDNLIWIGSDRGIFRLNPETLEVQSYTNVPNDFSSLSNNLVFSIYEDSQGELWFGTQQGLNHFNRETKRFERTDVKDGLANGVIYTIEEDNKGNLWMTTNYGISTYNPITKQIKNYDESHGLRFLEFNLGSSFSDREFMYFGGTEGLVYFRPEDIEIDRYPPKTVFREFLIANQPVPIVSNDTKHKTLKVHINYLDEINLTHKDSTFGFEFAAIHYVHPEANRFAFKLEGFDRDWVYARPQQHSATYTNIPPGRYHFFVKAANPDGVWGKATSIQVTIFPAPWKTSWAYLGYFIITITIIGTILGQHYQKVKADKLSQQAIAASEKRYRNFVNNSTEGIWHLDIDPPVSIHLPIEEQVTLILSRFRVVNINSALAQMYDLSLEEICGKQSILFEAFDQEQLLKKWIEKGYQISGQTHICQIKDSRKFWFSRSYTGEVFNDHLTSIWGVQRDITILKRHLKIVEYQAQHDNLTGLKNRHWFYEQARDSIIRVKKSKYDHIAFILLDFNDFKQINDSLGHEYGDKLLKKFGHRLSESLKFSSCFFARIGGDEFIFITFYRESLDRVNQLIEKILKTLEQTFIIDEVKVKVTGSLGVSLSSLHGKNITTLMRYADTAMYSAKRQKLSVVFFQEEKDNSSSYRLKLLADLKEAISENYLELYYQPKLNLQTNEISGCEALIRWNHPSLGKISPGVFIPLAEKTVSIHPLTYWVIDRAFAEWRDLWNFGCRISMAINLTVYNLYEPNLIKKIIFYRNKYKIRPEYIEFEITEGTFIEDIEQAVATMKKIHDLGFKLAIDDFGTGYSSLSYLKSLPIDTLKIDMQFIKNILKDSRDEALVKLIIRLSHLYSLKVVAEGIEDRKTQEKLKSYQCDYGQGYHISRPLQKANFLRLIQNHPLARRRRQI